MAAGYEDKGLFSWVNIVRLIVAKDLTYKSFLTL